MYTFAIWVISWAMWIYNTTQEFHFLSCYLFKGCSIIIGIHKEFVFVVLHLSFSFSYPVELKILQSNKNEANWA